MENSTKVILKNEENLSGIGGWLLFFCIVITIFNPLRTAYQLIEEYAAIEGLTADFPFLNDLVYTETVFSVLLALISIFVGIKIWSVNKTKITIVSVRMWLAILFAALIAIPLILEFIIYATFNQNGYLYTFSWLTILGNAIYAIIWWQYFKRSVRVKNTFSENAQSNDKLSSEE